MNYHKADCKPGRIRGLKEYELRIGVATFDIDILKHQIILKHFITYVLCPGHSRSVFLLFTRLSRERNSNPLLTYGNSTGAQPSSQGIQLKRNRTSLTFTDQRPFTPVYTLLYPAIPCYTLLHPLHLILPSTKTELHDNSRYILTGPLHYTSIASVLYIHSQSP